MAQVSGYHSYLPLQGLLKQTKDTLLAHQQAQAVVGNNLANIDTEGYHRQRAELETGIPLETNPGSIGSGVRVAEIARIIDRYAEAQVLYERGAQQRWEAEQQALTVVENTFTEIQDHSLSGSMEQFWRAWEDLANDPDGLSSRMNVLQKGENMALAFHGTANGMLNTQRALNLDLQEIGEQINTLASQVAVYNQEIMEVTARGQNPNDLMDKRDKLILDMADLAGVTTEEGGQNSVTVYIGQEAIVHREVAREVVWINDDTKGKHGGDLAWADMRTALTFDGGEALGKLNVRDEVIPDVLNKLDELANSLRDRVNELHMAGVARDGSTGNAFFRTDTEGAQDIALHLTVQDQPQKLAASYTNSTGDNELAHDLFEVQYENAFLSGKMDYGEYYQSIVTGLGNEVELANTRLEASEAALEQAKNYQQSISGVSMDEELTNMITIQKAYGAAARVFNKIDEMLAMAISIGA